VVAFAKRHESVGMPIYRQKEFYMNKKFFAASVFIATVLLAGCGGGGSSSSSSSSVSGLASPSAVSAVSAN